MAPGKQPVGMATVRACEAGTHLAMTNRNVSLRRRIIERSDQGAGGTGQQDEGKSDIASCMAGEHDLGHERCATLALHTNWDGPSSPALHVSDTGMSRTSSASLLSWIVAPSNSNGEAAAIAIHRARPHDTAQRSASVHRAATTTLLERARRASTKGYTRCGRSAGRSRYCTRAGRCPPRPIPPPAALPDRTPRRPAVLAPQRCGPIPAAASPVGATPRGGAPAPRHRPADPESAALPTCGCGRRFPPAPAVRRPPPPG